MAKALEIISSLIRFDNSDMENRVYDIMADVHVVQGVTGNVENGQVRKNGNTVAIFSFWDGNKSATYYDLTSEEEHSVDYAINDFRSMVESSAAAQTMSLK